MVERHVITNDRRLADHHTKTVVNDKSLADFGAGMDFNSSHNAPNMGQEPGNQKYALLPQPVAQTVSYKCVKSRIAKYNLQCAARCGVSFEITVDIFAKGLENHGT